MRHTYSLLLFALAALAASCERNDETDEILKFYGDVRDDMAYSITESPGAYYLCGQLTEVKRTNGNHITGSKPRVGIVKTDLSGNMIWKKYLGDVYAGSGSKVILLNDGSVLAAGQVTDSVSLETDLYVARLSSSGTLEDENVIKIDRNQACTDIIQTPDGFLLLGTTDAATLPDPGNPADSVFNYAGYLDILFVRLRNNLEVIEAKQWGYPWNDRAVSLKADRNDGYVVAGTTDRHANKGRKNDFFLMRVNSVANITRPVILDSKNDEFASDLEVLDDGYLIAGTSGSETELRRPHFARVPFDIYDTVYYPVQYLNTSSWTVNSITRLTSNYFVAAGRQGQASSADMLFFAFDEWGNMADGKVMIHGSSGSQTAYDVLVDEEDFVIGAGVNSGETNAMITFLKFRF
ncbi:MAG: hypothetical protein MUE74_04260 [Bacteroidales bacterium]|jgi:hypothetical protein|nr:hypothetical protein [Bacteroidales bacterium]